MDQSEREALAQQIKDKETLARIDQQLKDSVQNQMQIMNDLEKIFNRIELDSKAVTTLGGEIKGHLENSKLRWDELENKLRSLNKNIEDCEEHSDENTKCISSENKEREKFQQDVSSTIRTIGWVFGGLATLAAILSGVVLLLQVFGKLKGI